MRQSARVRLTTLLAIAISQGLLAGEAKAVKQHIQKISETSAKAMCKNHGGSTSCDFCHRDHCHSIGGCSKGKCYNTVYRTAPRPLKPISGGLLDNPNAALPRNPPAGPGPPVGGGAAPPAGGAMSR